MKRGFWTRSFVRTTRGARLTALGGGLVAIWLFHLLWPYQASVWAYVIVFVCAVGAGYKALLEQTARERIIDALQDDDAPLSGPPSRANPRQERLDRIGQSVQGTKVSDISGARWMRRRS